MSEPRRCDIGSDHHFEQHIDIDTNKNNMQTLRVKQITSMSSANTRDGGCAPPRMRPVCKSAFSATTAKQNTSTLDNHISEDINMFRTVD